MHPMLNIAVRAARSAGQVIAKNFGNHANVQTAEKAKNDLVTNVDREAEQAIVRALLKAYPDHCVVGEEFGKTDCNYKKFNSIYFNNSKCFIGIL